MRPVLVITTIAAVAAATALGASAVVRGALEVGEAPASEVVADRPAVAALPGEPGGIDLDAIIARNIFDSRAPAPDSTRTVPVGATVDGVTVLGTLVTEPASMSSALVRLDSGEATQILGLGDSLGDQRVAAITPLSVHLEPFRD